MRNYTVTDMTFKVVLIAWCFNILFVENEASFPLVNSNMEDFEYQHDNPLGVMRLRDLPKTTQRSKIYHEKPFGYPLHKKETKRPCSVMVVSSGQNSAIQSLLRKYRYDANGVLIPSSVKYYIKMPQGFGSAPLLVPLTEKAFSPLGGFVRYYKEVPPIPPSL